MAYIMCPFVEKLFLSPTAHTQMVARQRPMPKCTINVSHPVETPSIFQTLFLETMLGELGRLSCPETRHGVFSSTFRRRILHRGYIAWRILRSGTLEGHAGWSFDPGAEGAMTTARPPRSLLICPCLSFCQRDCCISPCCDTS